MPCTIININLAQLNVRVDNKVESIKTSFKLSKKHFFTYLLHAFYILYKRFVLETRETLLIYSLFLIAYCLSIEVSNSDVINAHYLANKNATLTHTVVKLTIILINIVVVLLN